ncbi:hypothetical protein HKBW3C_03047, partial [Candidatus Hakubella thermalkaliphila]
MSGELFGVVLLPLALPIAAVGIPVVLLLEASRNARLKAERENIAAKLEAEKRRKEVEQRLMVEKKKTKAIQEKLKEKEKQKEEEERKIQLACQEEERLRDIEKNLLHGSFNFKKIEQKSQPQKVKGPKRKEADVLLMLQSLELKISGLEPILSELIRTDLIDMKNSLNEIKDKISGNYSYFENILKWLDIRLKEAIKRGERKLEDRAKELDTLSEKAIELLTDIEMIINSPLLPDKGRALELKAALESAMSGHDINMLKIAIERLTPEIKELYQEYLEMEKLNDEREYTMKSVQSVLAEMGYKVSKLPFRTVENAKAPLYMEFDIPEGEGVRLGFGMDRGILAEVFHPENRETNREKFEEQEKRWCSDIKKIGAKLKDKGIVFEKKWTRHFTDAEIERIITEPQVTDETKKEEE